jgi:hypothetical protein
VLCVRPVWRGGGIGPSESTPERTKKIAGHHRNYHNSFVLNRSRHQRKRHSLPLLKASHRYTQVYATLHRISCTRIISETLLLASLARYNFARHLTRALASPFSPLPFPTHPPPSRFPYRPITLPIAASVIWFTTFVMAGATTRLGTNVFAQKSASR